MKSTFWFCDLQNNMLSINMRSIKVDTH